MAETRRLVYVLERFPSDTLNFVYNEIDVLEREGFDIRVFSLLPPVYCPRDAERFLARTRMVRPAGAAGLVRALAHYAARRPGRLLHAGWRLLRGLENPSPGRLARSLFHFLVGVRFAYLARDAGAPVHAHFAFKAATAALVASELDGTPFSFTAHGSAVVLPDSRYSLAPKVRAAARVVAVSEYNRRVMLELCPDVPPERIVVNRTGIRLERFPYRDPDIDPARPLRLVNVASLYPVKNHEGMLAVAAELKRREVPFTLDVYGKDDAGRRVALERRAAELGVAAVVHFRGLLDHADVPGVLAEHDVFLLTSHSEGVPVAVMEAMATGLPVVVSRVTGVPELVRDGETGFLAPPNDPALFAQRLAELHADPALSRRLAQAARATVEADYDMEKNARRLARLFTDYLAEVARSG